MNNQWLHNHQSIINLIENTFLCSFLLCEPVLKCCCTFRCVEIQRSNQGPKTRPASTLGFLRPEPPRSSGSMSGAKSNEDLQEEDSGAPKPPAWLVQWDKDHDTSDGTADGL